MPTDEELRNHLLTLDPATLRTLQESGAWDTLIVGGEEADIDLFYQSDSPRLRASPHRPADRPAGPHAAGFRALQPALRPDGTFRGEGNTAPPSFLKKRSRVLRSRTGHDHDGGKGRTSITLVAYV
jgi:hypothetical protein